MKLLPEMDLPIELPMRPARLLDCLHTMGWTLGELCRRLQMHPDAARHWAHGRKNIPHAAACWLESLAARFEAAAVPRQPWDQPWAEMTGTEFAACLRELGWSEREVARRLHCSLSAVGHMAAGTRPIGADVADWLAGLRGCLRAAPVPEGWRNVPLASTQALPQGGAGAARRAGCPLP